MIEDIKKISIKHIPDERGDMFVLENNITLDMNFVRTFLVYGNRNINRGSHAHKKCSQLLIAINGTIEVMCKDSDKERKFVLSNPKEALLIPPKIWSIQIYKEDNSILGVWCDEPYQEEDYIRNWDEFLTLGDL